MSETTKGIMGHYPQDLPIISDDESEDDDLWVPDEPGEMTGLIETMSDRDFDMAINRKPVPVVIPKIAMAGS